MKRFVTFFVALSVTMLMGVTAHAATYGLEASKADGSNVSVPVNVTTKAGETTNINGYILKFEYDSTKVTPKVSATKDATGADCYATVDETFAGGVMVSDIIEGTDGTNTLVVAWAGPTAVQVGGSAEVKEQLATVDFEVKDTSVASVPLTVTAATVAKDASSAPETVPETSIASGSIDLAAVIYGDVNGNGVVDPGDASDVAQNAAKILVFDEQKTKLADVNGNGVVDPGDASDIAQYAAKLINSFTVESNSK